MATVTTKRKLNTDSSPVKKRRFCPPCSEFVGYSTYYRHRDKYFDLQTQQWKKATVDTTECITESSDDDIVVCESKLHFCLLHGKRFFTQKHLPFHKVNNFHGVHYLENIYMLKDFASFDFSFHY